MTLSKTAVVLKGLLLAATLAAPHAAAQSDAARYPARPVKIVVPLTAGGPTDILARIIGQSLSEKLGQPVVIDNRPGAGGNIGAESVAKSPPDGYTLFMGTSGPMSINASLYGNLAFDPQRDLVPVIGIAAAPFVVSVNPRVPASSLKELLAYARKNPGKLNYGAVSGSASHLATALFLGAAGVDMTFIPYKGAAPATTDLISGQIDVSFLSTPGSVPYIKAGKLKGLAVTSARRIDTLSELPSVAESGIAGYEASVWYGLVAPAGTPKEIVARLHRTIAAIMQEPAVRERMRSNDFDPTGLGPEEFAAFIREETVKWSKVVKALGLKAD
jgi:tripartite-type tricarboxylate transporter receptor subunit TctC